MEKIIFDRIRKDITSSDVVLYMKGTASFPMCGFSAAVAQILSQMNVQFKAVNVLEDNDIRQGIKDFADWPTIPQLYVKGEFIGGSDIIREIYMSRELHRIFDAKGIRYAVMA